jgi:hypothetical protein
MRTQDSVLYFSNESNIKIKSNNKQKEKNYELNQIC